MSAPFKPEVREEAYCAWRSCAGSAGKTVRALKEKGIGVDAKSVCRWRDKYGWNERARREDVEEKIRGGTPEQDDAARLIADLEAKKARYDRFFEGLGENGIDVRATYAYTALVKTIADIRQKAARKPDLYAMTPIVMEGFVRFIKASNVGAGVRDGVFDLIDRFFDEIEPE
jgi:hypothetical protein